MLELYHWEPNATSAKLMICLKEKGLAFTGHYVDILEFEQYTPEFLALNPAGQVPVLVDNGHVMADSTLVNEYLAEAYPEPRLAPGDPKGWYEIQAWGKFVEYNLDTSVSTLGWQNVMAPRMRQRDQEKLRQAVEKIPVHERREAWRAAIQYSYGEEQLANSRRKIELAIKRMEEVLSGSPWLMGQDYSIADIDTYAQAHTLPQLTPDIVNEQASPRTMEWLQRTGARPAVREAMSMVYNAGIQPAYAPGPEHSRWG